MGWRVAFLGIWDGGGVGSCSRGALGQLEVQTGAAEFLGAAQLGLRGRLREEGGAERLAISTHLAEKPAGVERLAGGVLAGFRAGGESSAGGGKTYCLSRTWLGPSGPPDGLAGGPTGACTVRGSAHG